MVASAVFIMDTKGKVIISRNYRGDIPMSVSERYVLVILHLSKLLLVCRPVALLRRADFSLDHT